MTWARRADEIPNPSGKRGSGGVTAPFSSIRMKKGPEGLPRKTAGDALSLSYFLSRTLVQWLF
jgi:hypothetical protein